MFKNAPSIYELEELYYQRFSTKALIDEKWVPARPCGYYGWRYRLQAAWLVLIGKGDVVIWPGGQ